MSNYYFKICDICRINTDIIVNAANCSLLGGGGVDGAIHRAAGPGLLKECIALNGCRTGEAKITKGYRLTAKYIIHTPGPIYNGSNENRLDLINCYMNSLNLAREYKAKSIAFPAISTGVYGYPIDKACVIAIQTINNWIKANDDYDIDIIFSCFDQRTYDAYINAEKLYRSKNQE